jgi:transposase
MDIEAWAEIRRLFLRERWSKRHIARKLRVDRKTVNAALAMERYEHKRTAPSRGSKLDQYKDRIAALLQEHPELSAVRIFEEIKREGYDGRLTVVRDFLRSVRPKSGHEAFVSIDFPPGDAAQVDWASCGHLQVDGQPRRLSAFVFVLCASRFLYVEFTLSERMETFLACHERAFAAVGGVPRRILYDNLRCVVLARADGEVRLHPRFLDFAAHYGFRPTPCAPYRPNEKGRVENGVRYLKYNFLAGRKLTELEDANREVARWLAEVANVREHKTTHRRPVDLLATERPLLWPLPKAGYDTRVIKTVKASPLCRVHFDGSTYSVPPAWAGCVLTLKASAAEVCVYAGADEVARHRRAGGRQDVVDPEHLRTLRTKKRRADRGVLVQRFLAIGGAAEPYLKGLVAAEVALYRHLRRILALCDRFGRDAVAIAITKAIEHRAFGADYVERILLERRRGTREQSLGPLSLLTAPDLADIALEDIDLTIYDRALGEEEDDDDDQAAAACRI